MILVTGATGQVGSAAMNALVAAYAMVRALVRRPSEFAAPEGVEVVLGSFDDDRSFAKALEGVDLMLLAGRDSPNAVSQNLRVLAHARRAGAAYRQGVRYRRFPRVSNRVDARTSRNRRRNPKRSSRLDAP